MDATGTQAAFEGDVELDSDALRKQDEKRGTSRARKAARAGKPRIDTSRSRERDGDDENANEASPLLPPDEDDSKAPWSNEFSHLPWYKQPNIFWVLAPFFLMATAFGGSITPKLNLILELVCSRYIKEQSEWDPTFAMAPVDFGNGDNDQCRIPEVQARVAEFNLMISFIAGLLSAITSPKLGALSDRYGRKPILIATSVGTIIGEGITVFAAKYPETFPINMLIVGSAIDGLTGSFIVAMAISNAYAVDCTPPAQRNVAFGFFHGSLFTGIAVGPILAGYLVKWSGQIVVVFYLVLAVHISFILFITAFVPESLSKKRQLEAREKHLSLMPEVSSEYKWLARAKNLNILEPLKVLWPTGPGSSPALRRNLFFLSAVDTIVFGVAMGSLSIIVVYTNYQFGWKSFESGKFLTIINSCRVFCLLVVLPGLTRLVRGKYDPTAKQKNEGCDRLDLGIIQVAVLFDMLGYLGYSLARTGPAMIMSGVIAAIGGIGSPTLQSCLTKHIPSDQTGQLLGAIGLLHALARVVAPTIFNAIYAATVKDFPQTVFVSLTATFGVALLFSLFLKTRVYFDEDRAAEAARQETRED